MRIGTWNLDARWTDRHATTLAAADCDVWLLTEIVDAVALPGHTLHRCAARMSRGQHYAGVMTRLSVAALPDPHPASAAVRFEAITLCASILPWASKDDPTVWGEGNQGERTRRAVDTLAGTLVPGSTVWAGDFNHALDGPTRYAGSVKGRQAINDLVRSLRLSIPTAQLPHRITGIGSIDHIGVPDTWTITEAVRLSVAPALSDHDAYVVTARPRSEEDEP